MHINKFVPLLRVQNFKRGSSLLNLNLQDLNSSLATSSKGYVEYNLYFYLISNNLSLYTKWLNRVQGYMLKTKLN